MPVAAGTRVVDEWMYHTKQSITTGTAWVSLRSVHVSAVLLGALLAVLGCAFFFV